MSNFIDYSKDQLFLLPPSLNDWVSDDDLAHFILEAVEHVDMSAFHVLRTGSGKAQYHPRMMLALLIYCYANGIFSSRKIEQATYRHVSVRFIAANTHPDHDTIATFRRRNGSAFSAAFEHILPFTKTDFVAEFGEVNIHRALSSLTKAGKIRRVCRGVYDYPRYSELLALLDPRPEKSLTALCREHGVRLLCYGTLAGGFLSERWLGARKPHAPENRSLVKYLLIIEEIGGWALFQELLAALAQLARNGFIWRGTQRWDHYGIAAMTPGWIEQRFAEAGWSIWPRGAENTATRTVTGSP